MKADRKRASGFYWVRFEGELVVAEYTSDGLGCSPEGPHWHVPGCCFLDSQICELLCPIPTPRELAEAQAALPEVVVASALKPARQVRSVKRARLR